jgi:hypothetical protein
VAGGLDCAEAISAQYAEPASNTVLTPGSKPHVNSLAGGEIPTPCVAAGARGPHLAALLSSANHAHRSHDSTARMLGQWSAIRILAALRPLAAPPAMNRPPVRVSGGLFKSSYQTKVSVSTSVSIAENLQLTS